MTKVILTSAAEVRVHVYSKVITCCKVEEAKLYKEMLAKVFYWILTDLVALIGEYRTDVLGRAGLETALWLPRLRFYI